MKCHKNRAEHHSHARVVSLIHLLFSSDLLSKRIWRSWRFSQYGAKQKTGFDKSFLAMVLKVIKLLKMKLTNIPYARKKNMKMGFESS